jgi:hypothetical protein
MEIIRDYLNRNVRLTEERKNHIIEFHPELRNQMDLISEVLLDPEKVVESKSDDSIELFYRYYTNTMVGEEYLCVVVKVFDDDYFIVTV